MCDRSSYSPDLADRRVAAAIAQRPDGAAPPLRQSAKADPMRIPMLDTRAHATKGRAINTDALSPMILASVFSRHLRPSAARAGREAAAMHARKFTAAAPSRKLLEVNPSAQACRGPRYTRARKQSILCDDVTGSGWSG